MEDKSNIVTGTVGTRKAARVLSKLLAQPPKTREAIPALTGPQMTQMRRIQNARFTKHRKPTIVPERLRAGFYIHGQHAKKEAAV